MADAQKLFELLVRDNADMLTAYLSAALRDGTAVEDVFQETLLVAWRRLDECDTSRPFGPWLRGIAAKLVLAHYRKFARREQLCGQDVLDELELKFAQFHRLPGKNFDEKLDALRNCIERLPHKYKQAVDLHYKDEIAVPVAAERLAVGIEAFRKRLQRARGRLLDCLNRRLAAADA